MIKRILRRVWRWLCRAMPTPAPGSDKRPQAPKHGPQDPGSVAVQQLIDNAQSVAGPAPHPDSYKARQRERDRAWRWRGYMLCTSATKPGRFRYEGREYQMLRNGTRVRLGKPDNRARKLARKRTARANKRRAA